MHGGPSLHHCGYIPSPSDCSLKMSAKGTAQRWGEHHKTDGSVNGRKPGHAHLLPMQMGMCPQRAPGRPRCQEASTFPSPNLSVITKRARICYQFAVNCSFRTKSQDSGSVCPCHPLVRPQEIPQLDDNSTKEGGITVVFPAIPSKSLSV